MIEEIYLELKAMGKVRSASEFSTIWLSREQSYVGVLRCKKRRPSAQVISTMAVKLTLASDVLLESAVADDVAQGVRLQAMATRCVGELIPRAPIAAGTGLVTASQSSLGEGDI